MASVKCGKCCADLVSGEVSVKCADCAASFHPTCTRFGSSNITKAKLKSFKCDDCKGDLASVKSSDDPSEDTKNILEAINRLDRNFEVKVGEITTSIAGLSGRIESLSNKFDAMDTKVGVLDERCVRLEQARDQLQGEVQQLRQQLRDADQHSRCANVEIVGLPLTAGEDIYAVLKNIAGVIGVPFKREDFSVAHRLRLFSKRHAHPPVIAQFVSRSTRDTWLFAARRKRGINSRDVAASLPQSTIYLNEQLTGHNRALLGRARRLLRAGRLHYAGFANGKVLVKHKESDAAVRIFDMEDLDKYDA